jgi:hypothetical protein
MAQARLILSFDRKIRRRRSIFLVGRSYRGNYGFSIHSAASNLAKTVIREEAMTLEVEGSLSASMLLLNNYQSTINSNTRKPSDSWSVCCRGKKHIIELVRDISIGSQKVMSVNLFGQFMNIKRQTPRTRFENVPKGVTTLRNMGGDCRKNLSSILVSTQFHLLMKAEVL